MSWAEIGAVTGILALFEAPLIAMAVLAWSWVKTVNERLERIEERSYRRRRTDSFGD